MWFFGFTHGKRGEISLGHDGLHGDVGVELLRAHKLIP